MSVFDVTHIKMQFERRIKKGGHFNEEQIKDLVEGIGYVIDEIEREFKERDMEDH